MSQVKIAILGCGGMAGSHAQRLAAHADADIVALCDVSSEVVENFIARNLSSSEIKPQIFTDAAQMYAQANLEAVIIVTPHTMHFEHAMQALDAGCHVFLEKPMVTDSSQAHRLADKVEAVGKILVIGYNTPCTASIHYIREAIRSGELGKLELVSGWLSQDWKRLTTGTWRQQPELSGGGQMYDSGAHIFNTLVWTVEQPVAAVHAFVDNMDTGVDINGTANIRFANGVLATLTISGNCPVDGANLTFLFDGGRIECDGWYGTWIKVFKGTQEITDLDLSASQAPTDNFLDAILGRAQPRTSAINGVNQSEIMDAIYESARTGQTARPARAKGI